MRVVAVVLAAGSSSRLGRAKQEIVFRGATLLDRAIRTARLAAPDVIVVVNAPASRADARFVVNEDAAEGIGSSIRAGVAAAGDATRILVTLCDQPFVTPEHLRSLLAIDAPIVATGYRGIAGVPACFQSSLFGELLALRGDRGARVVIEAHRDETIVVPFEDAAIDIDTDQDAERLA